MGWQQAAALYVVVGFLCSIGMIVLLAREKDSNGWTYAVALVIVPVAWLPILLWGHYRSGKSGKSGAEKK